MFKHTVSYFDFNGNERKDELHFHLSTPEVVRLEAELGTTLEEHVKKLQADQNLNELLKFLEKMILNSYGVKTTDGKSFTKNKGLRDEFEYSQAYAEIFEQFMTDESLAVAFGQNVADKGKNRKNYVAPKVVENQPNE